MDFETLFHCVPDVIEKANARVNILGEHTDYNRGLVLPMLIPYSTEVSLGIKTASPNNTVSLYSENISQDVILRTINDDKAQGNWTDYVVGVLHYMLKSLQIYCNDIAFPSFNIYIKSNIPQGAGLSSSAALEIAIARAVRTYFLSYQSDIDTPNHTNIDILSLWSDINLAKIGQMAENHYVGLPCGLMDQMVISMGNESSATMIDFADNENPNVCSIPIFNNVTFMVIASGYTHRLLNSGDKGYQTRYNQCQESALILEVEHLSTISPLALLNIKNSKKLSPLLESRVTHIVHENQRVRNGVYAMQNNDSTSFATYMNESHISQRDLYEVSIPEIDAMVETALNTGAMGARLTGGGFGGSIIAMVKKETYDKVWNTISQAHPKATLLV